jgi:hypothetical protein
MRGNNIYLEAPDRIQDLLNIKWTLRSAGYDIRSTWHEGNAITTLLAFRDHWNPRTLEHLQNCDALVVICGNGDRSIPELAMMAGFALARGIRVFWVGSPVKSLLRFPSRPAIQQGYGL